MSVKKWEYKVLSEAKPGLSFDQELASNLNQLGKEGWEAFAAWGGGSAAHRILLKRPIEES